MSAYDWYKNIIGYTGSWADGQPVRSTDRNYNLIDPYDSSYKKKLFRVQESGIGSPAQLSSPVGVGFMSSHNYLNTNVGSSSFDFFVPVTYISYWGYTDSSTANTTLQSAYTGSDYAPGTGDFTHEAWVKPSIKVLIPAWQAFPTIGFLFSNRKNNSQDRNAYAVTYNYLTNKFQFRAGNTFDSNGYMNVLMQTTDTYELDNWYHVAVVRSGTLVTLYVNGEADGSVQCSYDLNDDIALIGGSYYHSPDSKFGGYMQDIRLTKGIARYTGSFEPPGKLDMATDIYANNVSYLLSGEKRPDLSDNVMCYLVSGEANQTNPRGVLMLVSSSYNNGELINVPDTKAISVSAYIRNNGSNSPSRIALLAKATKDYVTTGGNTIQGKAYSLAYNANSRGLELKVTNSTIRTISLPEQLTGVFLYERNYQNNWLKIKMEVIPVKAQATVNNNVISYVTKDVIKVYAALEGDNPEDDLNGWTLLSTDEVAFTNANFIPWGSSSIGPTHSGYYIDSEGNTEIFFIDSFKVKIKDI